MDKSYLRNARLLGYPAFRSVGWPRLLPLNLTISVTFACSSRCLTCNIWKKKTENLTVSQYDRIFRSLKQSIAWVTVSGGDPFLRPDLPEIIELICNQLQPKTINIPMNGILTKRIETFLPLIAKHSKNSKLVLNFSIDDIGERHDLLRGHKGNFDKALAGFNFAKNLQKEFPHITVGIHTVISRFNVERIPEIYHELNKLNPDSYIAEIAEERVELGTMGENIGPDKISYENAVDFLMTNIRENPSHHSMGRLVQALRLEYYQLTKQIISKKKQIIPCYAGWASAHLAPDGNVWGCCVRADSLGNVRDTGFDFEKIWHSIRAEEFRNSVRAGECSCPLANAAYSSILFSPRSLMKVGRNFFIGFAKLA